MQSNIVIVPHMAAVDLTALVEKKFKLKFLDPNYRRWNYYRDVDGSEIPGPGRKYEVLVWNPELEPKEFISSDAIRDHFRRLNAFGHAGAFMQWRRVCGLSGHHATILEDSDCYRDEGGNLRVLYSRFVDGDRRLDMSWFDNDWDDNWSFVAFRELA